MTRTKTWSPERDTKDNKTSIPTVHETQHWYIYVCTCTRVVIVTYRACVLFSLVLIQGRTSAFLLAKTSFGHSKEGL